MGLGAHDGKRYCLGNQSGDSVFSRRSLRGKTDSPSAFYPSSIIEELPHCGRLRMDSSSNSAHQAVQERRSTAKCGPHSNEGGEEFFPLGFHVEMKLDLENLHPTTFYLPKGNLKKKRRR
ncbi:hypothetical protein CEXT_799901 [Caerostris extrusa]|uniref:Uncharacterized protein n=1 Tax=Caerostris extrusa TaxID=172846 RepID=A0AAV4QEN7_CAEEX|nr:hypothetical protein CEXT_799901 [Caerostris extrusa]